MKLRIGAKKADMKVFVIGGAGFVGRSVVAALISGGNEVVIGTRRPERARGLQVGCRIEKVELHRLTRPDDWLSRIQPFDVVINCAGILRERRGETFDSVYRQSPAAIAEACRTNGKRFVHITALGLRADARSGFITCKLAGERAIERVGGQVCIVRPSLLDGKGGYGSRWIRRVAQWPVHFIPADATGVLAPLDVRDLADAIAALSVCPASKLPTSVELGGEACCSMAQHLAAMRVGARPAMTSSVPAWIVRVCAHALDIFHLTPLSWGHVELMRRDNVPRASDVMALRRWIGRTPTNVRTTRAAGASLAAQLPAAGASVRTP